MDEPLTDLEEISKLEPLPFGGENPEYKMAKEKGKLRIIETPILKNHPGVISYKYYSYVLFTVDAVDQKKVKKADLVYVGNIERMSNLGITQFTGGKTGSDIDEVNFMLNEELRTYSNSIVREKLFIEPNRIVSWL